MAGRRSERPLRKLLQVREQHLGRLRVSAQPKLGVAELVLELLIQLGILRQGHARGERLRGLLERLLPGGFVSLRGGLLVTAADVKQRLGGKRALRAGRRQRREGGRRLGGLLLREPLVADLVADAIGILVGLVGRQDRVELGLGVGRLLLADAAHGDRVAGVEPLGRGRAGRQKRPQVLGRRVELLELLTDDAAEEQAARLELAVDRTGQQLVELGGGLGMLPLRFVGGRQGIAGRRHDLRLRERADELVEPPDGGVEIVAAAGDFGDLVDGGWPERALREAGEQLLVSLGRLGRLAGRLALHDSKSTSSPRVQPGLAARALSNAATASACLPARDWLRPIR